MAAINSALVCLVPEAEALVGAWRERHDPAAANGHACPCHAAVPVQAAR